MSLSVEELKAVLQEFEIGNLAIFDDSDRPARGADRIAQAAIRELIALKEAEPVAYAIMNGCALISATQSRERAELAAQDMQRHHDLSGNLMAFRVDALIRKPE